MTRDEISRMAQEAEDYADTIYEKDEYYPGWLEVRDQRFAALVAAAEREACARVCEGMARPIDDEISSDAQWIASSCVRAIRARGET
jgi:hypothetical protein